ncbi:NAD kinase [uncultured archaeon]|nr:NAD kinase [uncultured archaeon]
MFKNILLVYSEKLTEQHISAVESIKGLISKVGIKNKLINVRDLEFKHFADRDLVITAGGDGTVIRTAHYIEDVPLLGINSEPEYSEGALTSLKDDEIDSLSEILLGNYNVLDKERAVAIKNGHVIKERAINEIYIGTEVQFATSRYVLKYRGNEEEQRSSGVLVATAGGSSAWYRSAGGKPFNHEKGKLAFLVREPYFGNLYQPTLLSGEILPGESIFFEGKKYGGGIVAIDSNKAYGFNNGDNLEVRISNKPLHVLTKK